MITEQKFFHCHDSFTDLPRTRGTSEQISFGKKSYIIPCYDRDCKPTTTFIFLKYYDAVSTERVEKLKYLVMTLTNQNSIQEEIKSRLNLGNACYHSVQHLLSSSLLSKNLRIKIHRTVILPVVLNGCESWSLTLRTEC